MTESNDYGLVPVVEEPVLVNEDKNVMVWTDRSFDILAK